MLAPGSGHDDCADVSLSLVELSADRPQLRKEPLIDCALQIARAERSARAAGRRTDDTLHQLHMFETPLRELLLVLQQRLGKEEEEAYW